LSLGRRGALLAAAALIAAGCAAPLKIGSNADPLDILASGALAYARLGAAAARELAPSLLPASEAKSLAPLLAKTRVLALGLGAPSSPSGIETPSFQACLIGDYPFRAASLSLGSDPAWKAEKSGFYNAKLGLRAAVPGPNLVLASSGLLEPLLAAARSPGSSLLPHELDDLGRAELLLWLPLPFSGLVASILGETMDVPARGLLLAAAPSAGDYSATAVFLMDDSEAARTYRPALRLAWYALAKGLLGGEAEEAIGASFSLNGDRYEAAGIRLSASQLAFAFSRLQGLMGPKGG
jgi:hypothetical protein